MHINWRNFLQQRGAQFAGESVVHFGDPAAELQAANHGAVIADVAQEGLIRVEGTDTRAFLQGQLSTDVLALSPATSQLSSWNNAKGRVITLLRLFERDGAIYMTLPQTLTAPVLKRLFLYVLRAKTKLTDVGDNLARFGLAGMRARTLLEEAGIEQPAKINSLASKDGIQIIQLHGDPPRYAVHGTAEALIPLWQRLDSAGARPAGENVWALLKILANEPTVYPETSEHFVAQMLGLEELDAINFKKGCYIGQEVIARAHYRGAVKRHLHRASCASNQAIPPGTPIHANRMEQAAGEVVDARQDSNGETQMLIVVQDEYRTASLSLPGLKAISLIE